MEEDEGVVICYGSKYSPIKHVLVNGLNEDQKDELLHKVEQHFPPELLMTYFLNTCEFWVIGYALASVREAVEAKLTEMNIPHVFQEGECY